VLCFLVAVVVVVVVALIGGLFPALFAAVAASLLINYFLVPPLHTFTIAETNNALALGVFVVVAAAVSSVVDLAARRTRQAARASAESQTLATLAGTVVRGEAGVDAMLEQVREAFAMTSASLLERSDGVAVTGSRGPACTWAVAASAGAGPAARPEDADVDLPVGDDFCLALRGRSLPAEDRRVLGAFAAHAAAAVDQHRLAAAAAAAKPIAEADRMRAALLATVSHDLRSPLAAAKAAVSSLRTGDVIWTPAESGELLAGADESIDQLARLVDNLLDMSRLQAGALSMQSIPTSLEEIVAHALADLGPPARGIKLVVSFGLPLVLADPALLERVVVNLLTNAIRYSPAGAPPTVTASALGDRVELRVIDRGPGIPEADRDRMFAPFQRPDSEANPAGAGLGLALSRGLTEAMQGTLTPEDTPGGGLTMTLSLPVGGTGLTRANGTERERERA
jgi:two-component system sensor histidine kinase KdpD